LLVFQSQPPKTTPVYAEPVPVYSPLYQYAIQLDIAIESYHIPATELYAVGNSQAYTEIARDGIAFNICF